MDGQKILKTGVSHVSYGGANRIPAWYNTVTGETYVGETDPEDTINWVQDEDVLDTWFSSALWPFATLGWPEETEDLARYYPTNTMVTGYDIIFFWVARMAFQARHFTKNRPFKDVLIHGLLRDAQAAMKCTSHLVMVLIQCR